MQYGLLFPPIFYIISPNLSNLEISDFWIILSLLYLFIDLVLKESALNFAFYGVTIDVLCYLSTRNILALEIPFPNRIFHQNIPYLAILFNDFLNFHSYNIETFFLSNFLKIYLLNLFLFNFILLLFTYPIFHLSLFLIITSPIVSLKRSLQIYQVHFILFFLLDLP